MSASVNTATGIGVDGCRAGWLAADKLGNWLCTGRISEIINSLPAQTIMVDMPMGLSGNGFHRNVEVHARKLLKGRASSIFNPPCRDAVYAENYQIANEINRAFNGKGISRQSWNIVPRIRELDTLIQNRTELKTVLREAHPELNFLILNSFNPLEFNKKSKEGFKERLKILCHYCEDSETIVSRGLNQIPRSMAAPDDFLDTLSLAILADGVAKPLCEPDADALGIPVNLWIPANP